MGARTQPVPLAGASREEPLTAIIFNVMRFSLHDGPGIRTTVFFKGCPLECHWCHNPESQNASIELAYFVERCRLCGDCVSVCPNGALKPTPARIERRMDACRACGACATVCVAGARELIGRRVSVAALMAEIERDVVFYDESGGGVTFSGGEPLMQAGFIQALAGECRARGIRTALDTCGFAPPGVFDRVAAAVDLVLYDLKAADPLLHRRYTGVPNQPILINLERAVRAGRPVVVRIPVVPGINDSDSELSAMRALLSRVGARSLDLLPYHKIGRDKYARLGMECQLEGVEPPSGARMSAIAEPFRRDGFDVTIGGRR